ncbi:MAG: hypothetical protein ABI741_06365 [Ferruginibacter sp.]
MKKQANNFTGVNDKVHLAHGNKTKKNTRYIYTEEDLGEGILYAGIIESYPAAKQENLNPQNNYSSSYSFLYL